MIETIDTDSGLNLYGVVRDSNDKIANGTSVESYSAAHWPTLYPITATEQGTSGHYQLTVPSYLGAGTYSVSYHQRSGASPAVGDPFYGARNFTVPSTTTSTTGTFTPGNTDAAYQAQINAVDLAISNLLANPRPDYTVGSVSYKMGDFLAKLYDIRAKILDAWKKVPADGWETTQQDVNVFGQDLDAYLNEAQ